MKFFVLFFTILSTCAIFTEAYSRNKRDVDKKIKRQTSADQMVQNILQWLQGLYAENTRTVRQGTLREYLPPARTEKPRPFQPGYPEAGITPQPPFNFFTNPATGGITAPDNEILPPETPREPQPSVPTGPFATFPPIQSTPVGPGEFPSETPINGIPHFPTHPSIHPDRTTVVPGTDLVTSEPGAPSVVTGAPEGEPPLETSQPGGVPPSVPSIPQPTIGGGDQGEVLTHPTDGIPAQPEVTKPPVEISTGYGVPSQPPRPGFPTTRPESPTRQPDVSTVSPVTTTRPDGTPAPEIPGSTFLPGRATPEAPSVTTESSLGVTPQQPGIPTTIGVIPSGDTLPTNAVPQGTRGPPSETESPAEPPGSAPTKGAEGETTLSPESNTIPTGKTVETFGPDDDEELKHPPHIHAIDVQCGKEMMTINIEFSREFNGIIYSKGYYNMPECRYVQENSGQTKYTFTVNLNMCGTEFVNAFDTEGKSYLENILVLQNEAGIQEVWDTIRSVRCLWEGNLQDTLSVAFSIGMLSQEIVTFSGDTAMAKLDVLMGRGPFGQPANGLVKIGEHMTLIVSVTGDPGFDLQVKDCKAIDSTSANSVQLTDESGCVLKPKLFGAFQKTRDTGNSGASIIAYSYFNAFKFPDVMDLMIECNIELCKTDCDMCSKDNQPLEPTLRRKREVSGNDTLADGVTMGKHLRVVLPEDLNEGIPLKLQVTDDVCMSLRSFMFSAGVLISLLTVTSVTTTCLWVRKGNPKYLN
ncbi:uncharacterized protein LOC132702010 isoform X2 [Cylas formicarius]|uniref:uncharacterized protein LOC132702010 isoform X2 n=1 Tax=Cylas formicarius TaxID=197179 RepID=UPI0029583FED|nr:uncharacterized protein LOC132702010 isoform X2 [Cylas formicarius]